ncbi:MFS transporter [Candidatus Woesearchaeota archaeon]|nr:MFS transporter [Candidatus Woesearchaeota archaeon]
MEFQKEEFRLLWKVYLAGLIRGIGAFFVPFVVIFLQDKSLTLAQIGVLFGVANLANFLFEIPTGVMADKYGRKFSALAGFVVTYLSFFFMIFVHSFYSLLFLFFLHAVGFTFISGAYDGWIYEYLKSHKKEHLMHNFYSRRLSFMWLGLIFSGLIGGYLASFLPLYLLLLLDTLFGVFFLFLMQQVPDPPIVQRKSFTTFRDFFEKGKIGFTLIKEDRNLLLIILASVGFTFSAGANDLLSSPIYIQLGAPLSYLGYFQALGGFLVFIIPNLLLHFSKRYSKIFLILFSALEGLLISSVFFVSNYILFGFLLAFSLVCGAITTPISSAVFQHHSKTEVRATVMSISQMFISLSYFIIFLFLGALADLFGAQFILALSGLFISISVVCYCFVKE